MHVAGYTLAIAVGYAFAREDWFVFVPIISFGLAAVLVTLSAIGVDIFLRVRR